MTVGARHYRVTLDGGNYFYLAGIWEPSIAEWPLSFRIITLAANPEVARYQERHGALIHRRQARQWIDMTAPEEELLVTPPADLSRRGNHAGSEAEGHRTMSRLWDTPEYWARYEADEMLREMEDQEPTALAVSFERSLANYDGDLDTAKAIIAELRRRATAGVRFWSRPKAINADTTNPANAITEDDIPW